MNVKDIRCPLQWWEKHGSMFPIITFCVGQILGMVGSQIEIEIIFSLPRILTSLRTCHLQLENFDKLIFVNKIWPTDPRIGCKPPSSLVDFIESDFNLRKKLKEFEGAFEKDKVVELWFLNFFSKFPSFFKYFLSLKLFH